MCEALGLCEEGLAALDRLLFASALSDVLDLADEIARFAGARSHERDGEQSPDDVSVLVEVALLHLVRADLAGEHLAHEFEIGLEIVRVRDVLERHRG